MKLDSGESLVYSYLRHVKKCTVVQTNWKPSGNWILDEDLAREVFREYSVIQRHKAFTEIFKTGFEPTVRQTEVDVLGIDSLGTVYAVNVTFNELGLNYGSKTDTRNRVVKNLLRAHLALDCYFPGQKHVLMFCSPKVTLPAVKILEDYFTILEQEFATPDRSFFFVANADFRDEILMETLERIHDEYDTNELFLRSFKLLTVFASEGTEEQHGQEAEDTYGENAPVAETKPVDEEPAPGPVRPKKIRKKKETRVEAVAEKAAPDAAMGQEPGEQPEMEKQEYDGGEETGTSSVAVDEPLNAAPGNGEKIQNEIKKVMSRVPKWFSKPEQTNSRILIGYMQLLEKQEQITLDELKEACRGVARFTGNFSQMTNIADINHGKVFNTENGVVTLWEPVKDFIIQEYILSKAAYYKSEE